MDHYGVTDSSLRHDILSNESHNSRPGYLGNSYSESDHYWETADGDPVINGFNLDTGEYVGHDFD